MHPPKKDRGPRAATAALVLTMLSLGAQAQDSNSNGSGSGRQRPPGPPPEAVQACAGKAAGTEVSFTLRDGKTLKGVCQLVDGVLAAAPPSMQGGKPSR